MSGLLVVMWSIGCGSGGASSSFSPLTTDGAHLRDDRGRIVLLRGVNARVEGVFDVTFDDGRVALEPIPALTDADCLRMRQLGFNSLRLPINWSGIEPVQGQYDAGYLSQVDRAVECAANAGLLVVIDLHQDAYSKHIGEDGAPLWAIVPEPEMLLEGPLTDLQDRRLSAQVAAAFASFFAAGDPHGLQAAFIAMLEHVAARYADHPKVVGIELFNEPDIGAELLDPFQLAAAEAVRRAAPDKLVFFEPPALRNLIDFQPLADRPFPVAGAVYSPHMYTFVFGNQESSLADLTKDALRPSVDNARAEANAHGTPLYLGEFGIGPTRTNADKWIGWQAELHDEFLASNAFWLWKEESQGSWGVHEKVGDGWEERPQVVGWVSRPQAHRIAGSDVSVRYDYVARTLEVEARDPSGVPHEIYVPEDGAWSATCAGAPVELARDSATGVAAVECDGALRVGPGA